MPTNSTTPSAFAALLAQYPSTHHHRHRNASKASKECDCDFRFTTAPGLVAARRKSNDASSSSSQSGAHLALDEVVRLVHWKINHGSFFPSLPKLAASNDAQTVRRVTREAFALLDEAGCASSAADSHATTTTKPSSSTMSSPPHPTDAKALPAVMAALNHLTSLRGIGPATASLLLSVASPSTVPFFADELFLWARRGFDGLAPLASKKSGGGTKIKYSAKEYEDLVKGTWGFLRRLSGEGEKVTAGDVEMVARVLGVLGREEGGARGDVGVVGEGGEEGDGVDKPVAKKRKRGAGAAALPVGGEKAVTARDSARKMAALEMEEALPTQRRVMPRRAAARRS